MPGIHTSREWHNGMDTSTHPHPSLPDNSQRVQKITCYVFSWGWLYTRGIRARQQNPMKVCFTGSTPEPYKSNSRICWRCFLQARHLIHHPKIVGWGGWDFLVRVHTPHTQLENHWFYKVHAAPSDSTPLQHLCFMNSKTYTVFSLLNDFSQACLTWN